MQLPLFPNTRRQPRRRPGATVVEFALCAPLLFLLVFGLIEMSRLFSIDSACTLAAMAGGRQAVIADSTATEVKDKAEEMLDAYRILDYTITTTPKILSPDTPQVVVRIDVPLTTQNGFFCTCYVAGGTVSHEVTRWRDSGD